MKRRAPMMFAALAVVIGCGGEDGDPRPHTDVTPPAQVGNLTVQGAGTTTLELSWTAPGDDSVSGTASAYDIRYSASDTTRWENMTLVADPPSPQPAGSAVSYTILGLTPNTTYVVRLATADEVPNWSEPSNAASGKTEREVQAGYVLVPAGTFTMGDGVAPCGSAERLVTLTHDYFLAQHEVTNQEFADLMQWAYTRGYVTISRSFVLDHLDGSTVTITDMDNPGSEIVFRGGRFIVYDGGHGVNPGNPMQAASWYGAAAYCDWLSLKEGLPRAYDHATWLCNGGDPYGAVGYRLPTDAEWEYAARYNDGRVFPWGSGEPDCGRVNWWGQTGGCVGWSSAVGSYPAGPVIGGRGLYDTAGNAWEWCNDWWVCSLADQATVDPTGPETGGYRVQRGGAWAYSGTAYLRCAARGQGAPGAEPTITGLRVARTVEP